MTVRKSTPRPSNKLAVVNLTGHPVLLQTKSTILQLPVDDLVLNCFEPQVHSEHEVRSAIGVIPAMVRGAVQHNLPKKKAGLIYLVSHRHFEQLKSTRTDIARANGVRYHDQDDQGNHRYAIVGLEFAAGK